MITNKRLFCYQYAAIRRHGEKKWTAARGHIEINPNYVVSISRDERDIWSTELDKPYIVELSNGTKFLMFMHNYGEDPEDVLLSDSGEVANSYVPDDIYNTAARYINYKYNKN